MAGWRGWAALAAGLSGVAGVAGSHDHPRGSSVSSVVAVTIVLLVACPAIPVAADREDYLDPRAAALRNLTRGRRQNDDDDEPGGPSGDCYGCPTSGAYGPGNGYSPCMCDDLLTGAVVCGDCGDGTDHDDLQNTCIYCSGDYPGGCANPNYDNQNRDFCTGSYFNYTPGCCCTQHNACLVLPVDHCAQNAEQAKNWNNDHSCDYRAQFRISDATSTTFAKCSNLTQCIVGVTFQPVAATQTSDRRCDYYSNCTLGTNYQSVAPTVTTDRVCGHSVTNCTLGANYQSAAPTLTTDRVCGHSVTNCALGTSYQFIAPTLTTNRVCAAVSNCAIGFNYQSAAPTATTDRLCKNLVTQCGQNQYQTAAPTSTSDRTCSSLTICTVGLNYQSVAPTLTTNRICDGNVTTCVLGATYQSAGPTETTNRVCRNVTRCTPAGPIATFVATPPTMTTDSVCVPCQICRTPQVVTAACTATTDTQCGAKPQPATTTSAMPKSELGLIVALSALLLGVGVYLAVIMCQREKRKSRQRYEESQLELAERTATVERLQSAWQIPEIDLTWIKQLAEGTFGEVWEGTWGNLRVAIKLLKRSTQDEFDPNADEDFRKECETLQSIKHPNLLIFYGAGTTEAGKSFMMTEYMALGSLRKVLHDPLQLLPWAVRLKIAKGIAKGMQHLHKLSIVHRDLKSDNVLLDDQLGAKVADFGTSRIVSSHKPILANINLAEDANGSTGSMTKAVGTLLWMAPEVFTGGTNYGPAVDVYSYAIIMWELITRKNPWDELTADSHLQLFAQLDAALRQGQRPRVPEDFEIEHKGYVGLMKDCWGSDPSERPSFEQVVYSFGFMGGDSGQEAATTGIIQPQAKPASVQSRSTDWRSATVGGTMLYRDQERPNPAFGADDAADAGGPSSNATHSSADDAVPLLGKSVIYE